MNVAVSAMHLMLQAFENVDVCWVIGFPEQILGHHSNCHCERFDMDCTNTLLVLLAAKHAGATSLSYHD